MVCMLLDHTGRTLLPDQIWMTCVGRLAFPIFAFQLAQGYEHTGNFKGYLRRMVLFALFSELPFDLLHGSPLYPEKQNVLFTFCISLLVLRAIDLGGKKPWGAVFVVTATFLGPILATVLGLDYGGYGVLMVLSFWALGKVPLGWLWQLAAMVGINCFAMNSLTWTLLWGPWELRVPVQAFAVLAMVPIGLYNGQKGAGGKVLQQMSYWFYPVHMLVLALGTVLWT